MLHRIKIPKYMGVLKEFLPFQRKLLEFACTFPLVHPLEEAIIKGVFEDYYATWLWGKLWNRKGEPSELAQLIVTLSVHVQRHPGEHAQILEAFDHDMDYYLHFDDQNFRFRYFGLDAQTQKFVQPLMMYCYHLLCQGLPITSPDASVVYFNRQQLVDAFWKHNEEILKVCPACDGQRPRRTERKAYSDADHFFPESLYPFLSIHPLNLVPTCTDCNRYFKLKTDPIEDHNCQSLTDSFHPYGRPAVQDIAIEILMVAKGASKVRITDIACSITEYPSSRVKNLDRVLHLEESWSGSYMDDMVEQIYRRLREIRSYRLDRQEPLGADLVQAELDMIQLNLEDKIGKEQYYLLKSSYAQYVFTHQDERDLLEKVLIGQEEENDVNVKWIVSRTL